MGHCRFFTSKAIRICDAQSPTDGVLTFTQNFHLLSICVVPDDEVPLPVSHNPVYAPACGHRGRIVIHVLKAFSQPMLRTAAAHPLRSSELLRVMQSVESDSSQGLLPRRLLSPPDTSDHTRQPI